ncbi:MAG: hypothetical protein V1799_13715 [bacterium]
MTIQIDDEKLFELVKKAVSEVIEERIVEFKLQHLPVADNEEVEEIRTIFGSPEIYRKQNFKRIDS